MLVLLFWLSLGAVGYAYLGYPLLLRGLNAILRRGAAAADELPRSASGASDAPSVSFVLVACDEADRIADRLRNLAACVYPGEREIVLVCDGCRDATAERARQADAGIPLRLVEQSERRGKAAGLNLAAAAASGEILVFADARQRFDGEAVARLVAPLRLDPAVAGVSGSLEIEPSSEGAATGIDAYWRLEKFLRREEALLDSVIGCTGAIYALRRSAYEPIPDDTLIDDVVVPMQALVRGGRILFEPAAKAYDPQTLAPERERRRKVRTLAGNYQMLFRYPGWLLPWRNRCWWQLVSHKYSRLAGPFLLAICFIASVALARDSAFFRLALAAQAACYLCGLVGLALPKVRHRWLAIPAGFLFLQWQCLRSLGHYLALSRRREQSGKWER